jgi:hypothetical protein
MEPNRVRKAPQGRPVENLRGEHTYARVPDCLWRLPPSERTAATEVWTALHHYLRVGLEPERITDESLLRCPALGGRSAEHAGKGLAILDRMGLIARNARGSRREVAIVAKLKGPRLCKKLCNPPDHSADVSKKVDKSPQSNKLEQDTFVPVPNLREFFREHLPEYRFPGI